MYIIGQWSQTTTLNYIGLFGVSIIRASPPFVRCGGRTSQSLWLRNGATKTTRKAGVKACSSTTWGMTHEENTSKPIKATAVYKCSSVPTFRAAWNSAGLAGGDWGGRGCWWFPPHACGVEKLNRNPIAKIPAAGILSQNSDGEHFLWFRPNLGNDFSLNL